MSEAYVIAINRLMITKIIVYDKVYEQSNQGSNSEEEKKNDIRNFWRNKDGSFPPRTSAHRWV